MHLFVSVYLLSGHYKETYISSFISEKIRFYFFISKKSCNFAIEINHLTNIKNMKKIFSIATCIAAGIVFLASCENTVARNFGGKVTINVPNGEKVVEATWKDDDNIWYLTEPMDSTYNPTVKHFRESSKMGVLEGEIEFVESR